MPKLDSGYDPASPTPVPTGGDIEQSADVPQLPKPIRCLAQPQCDSARQGLGCEHSMSRTELEEWLSRLRNHRVSVENAPRARTSNRQSRPAKRDEDIEI